MPAGPSPDRVEVGDDGLWLPDSLEATVDVLLGDQRLWSLDPVRDGGVVDDGLRLVAWPEALRPYLDGKADVRVREHLGGRVLFDRTVGFGSGEGVVRVVNPQGEPMAVNKWGKLGRPFSTSSVDTEALLTGTVRLIETLSASSDDPAFLCFGGLLGAVRTGRLIGHDGDLDVGYVSRHTHPADVIAESFRLERAVHRAGWPTRRVSGSEFRALAVQPGGSVTGIDVFGGFYVDDVFYLMPTVSGRLPREAILPLGTVRLEGIDVPAPASPEALLEVTYGAGWRQPDPAFRFEVPRATSRRLSGWFRGELAHLRVWEERHGVADLAALQPSDFARTVLASLPDRARVVDMGCGLGQDTRLFAAAGHEAVGHSYDRRALERAKTEAQRVGVPASFVHLNLYDARAVLGLAALRAHEGPTDVVYARGMVGALKDEGRRNLWTYSRMVLRARGRLLLEFATNEGTAHEPFAHEGDVRVLSHDRVVGEIEQVGGTVEALEVVEPVPPAGDRPATCRLTARWR